MFIFSPVFIGVAILIMLIISIGIFRILPDCMRKLCAAWPFMGFLVNLAASSFIVVFTGVASIVGIANMGASVLFVIYLFLYRRAHGIEKVVVDLTGPWKIRIFPVLRVVEKKIALSDLQRSIF